MPSNNRYRILSTKDVDLRLIELAGAQGFDIVTQSFINIRPLITDALKERLHQLLQQKIYAVFTSANAVNTIAQHYLQPDGKFYFGDWTSFPPNVTEEYVNEWKKGGFYSPGWDTFCLEGATQEAVKNAGINCRIKATGTKAADLAQNIIDQGDITSVVFFCGNKRRGELPDMLRQHSISVEEVVVYETTETPAISTEDYDGIFFLSPSAVNSFFSVNRIPRHTVCFSIGPTTATALQDYTDNKIITSTGPSMSELVQTAIFYFNNINCYE